MNGVIARPRAPAEVTVTVTVTLEVGSQGRLGKQVYPPTAGDF